MMNKEKIREIILIGRDRDCNFICNDPSVSRHHAQIIDYGASCSVVDLGSTNGTFVNGNKVNSEATLHFGDELRVGNVVVPWQQLVQPPQEPKSNKKLLWILIPIIAVLLIGGGLAIYFIYGNSKNKDKEAKEEKREVVEVLAEQLAKNEEQQNSINAKQYIIDAKIRKIDSLNEANEQAENRAARAAEREQEAVERERKAVQEANRKVSEANIRMDEAVDKLNEANEKLNEAEEKQTEAEQMNTEAEEKIEQANQTLELAESIKQERVMTAIESLNDEDIKEICRALEIEFNVRLSAKDALKKEFLTSNDERKQKIAIAIRQKQKSSNNDKK